VRALLVTTVLAVASPASAHHSASHWGPIYRERYQACTNAPHDVHCAGPIRAKRGLIAALHVGTLAPGKNHDHEVGDAHNAAVDAVYFNIREAIPALRQLLAIRLTAHDRTEHTGMEKQGLRAEAAYALAQLEDRASVEPIAALVVEFETTGYGSLWDDTLAALARLDPARASRYATDFIRRARDYRTSMPGGSSKLVALDYIVDASALPILEQAAAREEQGDDHSYCELMAARVRLDPALRANVRRDFLGHYGGTWLAGCAESVLKQLGHDPDDIDALARHLGRHDTGMDFGVANIAYDRILELLATTRNEHVREVVRRELALRTSWPHIAEPSHPNYGVHYVAMHFAALAAVGDASARQRLFALIDHAHGNDDASSSAWLAAYWAMRLNIDGAIDRAASLIARDVGSHVDTRSGVFHGIRTKLLDLYADLAPQDPRWTILLLSDPRSEVSERAIYRVSRHAPKGTCEAVIGVARMANHEAAEQALLALTSHGDTCRDAIGRLADDTSASREVRGAALELDAALGDPDIAGRIARAKTTGGWAPAIQRAELMMKTS
jgi:hypothetical protein